ncbi:MAG TPA: ABC transporter ATP-binding protein [Egibacteraceae bacterium]|nr:ABC transporter ATP-binding protein [Egibacteraceae bacterium]
MTAVIRTQGLTKRYGQTVGIELLDLDVEAGQVFGFLGPNGAGKTTTMRLLLDVIRPTEGRAEVLGLDVAARSLDIRRRVGYLPGDLRLEGRVTAHEMLTFLGRLRGGVPQATISALAERLDLDLSRPIRALSKGNKQKAGLIQAFMHSPELLILDEPTGGLDPLVQQEFLRMVAEVARDGRTVFLSSHVLDEVERAAHRVAIIRDGRLVAVEDVVALRERAVRRIEIHFSEPVEAAPFAAIDGVVDVRVDDRVLECSVEGSVDALIKAAAVRTVVAIKTHEPDLEKVFLTYYAQERSDAAV